MPEYLKEAANMKLLSLSISFIKAINPTATLPDTTPTRIYLSSILPP
jgi:hypothetical protein